MRTLTVLLLAMLVSAPAFGDAGIVRLSQNVGPWRVTVFTDPTPLRAGPVDVSFLIQDSATGGTVLDAEVDVRAVLGDRSVDTSATRADATNRMLFAALMTLPEPGRWTMEAVITTPDASGGLSLELVAEPPLAPWVAYVPWFAVPIVGIALFAGHQVLVFRQHRSVPTVFGKS